MSYHALARKYRPATFDSVVGQEHVTQTLRAALTKDKLAHAYLFSGPRGCGKTTVARLLAKALNCRSGAVDEPCGTCDACTGIAAGTWLDVLEIDAASHTGVDNIRELRDMAQYTPSQGSSRVFIIDEVHMLSKGAFNALLKILEEPPPRVFFFFATTEPNRLPRTILSRCQRFDFRLLSREELTGRIEMITAAENAALEPGAVRLVVAQADGSLRDAISVLDQLLASADGTVTEQDVVELFGLVRSDLFHDLNEAIIGHDAAAALRLAERVASGGQSLDDFARELVANFRNLLLLKIDPELAQGISLPEDQLAALRAQSERLASQDLLALLDRAHRGFEKIHRSTQPRILLEALLVELALMESRVLLSDLVRRLESLTGGSYAGGGGGGAPAPRPAAPAPRPASGEPPVQAAPAPRPAARMETAPAAPAAEPAPESGNVGQVFGNAAASTVGGWEQFIRTLLAKKPALGSCLLEGMPAEQDDGSILLSFPAAKAFHLQLLQNDAQALDAAAAEHLGKRIKLQVVNEPIEAVAEHRETLRREVAPTENEALDKACGEDKVLGDVVKLLDAEVVPEAERESWQEPAPEAPGTEEN